MVVYIKDMSLIFIEGQNLLQPHQRFYVAKNHPPSSASLSVPARVSRPSAPRGQIADLFRPCGLERYERRIALEAQARPPGPLKVAGL